MYAKVFDMMFDGSLGDCWQAWTTFVAMLVLSDREGLLPLTDAALSRRCGLPPEVVARGLEVLSAPDPHSSNPEEGGRRIVPLTPYGWRVVNKPLYRELATRAQVLEQNRIRQQRYRERNAERNAERYASVTGNAEVTPRNTIQITDTDTDTEEPRSNGPTAHYSSGVPVLDLGVEPVKDPVVVLLPLRGGKDYAVRESAVEEYRRTFPLLDVVAELRKMRGWGQANPTQRKTPAGIRRHIHGWLAKASTEAAGKPGSRRAADAEYMAENFG